MQIKYHKIERLLESNQKPLAISENVVLIIGTAANIGTITKIKGNEIDIVLKKDAVYYPKEKIAISRLINNRWRLSGYGEIK